MEDLGEHTITVVRDAPRNRHGDPTGAADEHTIERCNFQQLSTSEQDGADASLTESVWVFCPPGSDIALGDRVRFQGVTYRVQGRPAHRDDMQGQPHHVEVQLREDRGV